MTEEEAEALAPGTRIIWKDGRWGGNTDPEYGAFHHVADAPGGGEKQVWVLWDDQGLNLGTKDNPEPTHLEPERIEVDAPPASCPRCETGFTMEHDYLCETCRFGI